jgi:ferric-dicitrate binding protein FerR (iron transport regulator)
MNLRLLHKYANNKCRSEEVDEVLSWIGQSDEQSANFLFKQYWNLIMHGPSDIGEEAQALLRLDKIHHRINISRLEAAGSGPVMNQAGNKVVYLRWLYRVAVALLIPLITLFVYTRYFETDNVVMHEIISPPGSRSFLELPDGSKVWLNNGSSMVYPQRFTGGNRVVQLKGEGYFDVASNPSKPFVVESENWSVKAVGTCFNVKAYPDGSSFETTLESGKVSVQQNLGGKESVICNMSPGQHFALNRSTNKYILRKEETFKYVAWKEGKLVFDEDRLDKVAERLSLWYNAQIVLKDPPLSELTYKATFVDETLPEILEMMQVVMPITCVEVKRSKTDDGIYKKKEILIYMRKNK